MKLRIPAALVILASACLPAHAGDPLPSWNDGAPKSAIVSFVEKVTADGAPGYVPPAERIAVFDNDGTLWAENPAYFQLLFAIDRVKATADAHPEWKEKEPFKSVLAGDIKALASQGEKALLPILAATHAGMTAEEFNSAAKEWLDSAKHPTLGRRYVDCLYQPQLELLDYLRANGFKTFIVSGGGIDFLRVFAEEAYGIPPEQVVGSSIKVAYEVQDGKPVIIKKAEIDLIDDKAGKPVGIHQNIGRRPILAVGNSDGDFEMLEYTTTGAGARLGVLVHHDDAEREFAYDRDSAIGRLERGLEEASQRGWVVVSMKNDWKEVFKP